jgi:hypothetical protein
VLPKFGSELIRRTGTDRTEPTVLFCSVLVLSNFTRFCSQFSKISKYQNRLEPVRTELNR